MPASQQSSRFRTVPFVNNHDTFRPSQASPALKANGDYPTDTSGNMVNWSSNSELAPHIDPREPRLAPAYAFAAAVDGNITVFFEDLLNVGTTGKRYTHHPADTTELPIRADIANIMKCRKVFDWESGSYGVPSAVSDAYPTVNDPDHLIIERSGKAIIGISDNWNTWKATWITTAFPAGTRLMDYGGSSAATDIRTVTTDHRIQISTPPCNGTAKRRGYSIWAPVGTNIDAPLTTAAIPTTQEWELADDLGDSNPKSLMQGGALPARSRALRTAGKIFGKGGSTVTYKLFPSHYTTPLTVYLENGCGQVLDSISGAGALTKTFTLPADAWYLFQAKNAQDTSTSQRVWVNVTYTAPASVDALHNPSDLPTVVDLGTDRSLCTGALLNLSGLTGFTYAWSVNGVAGSTNAVQAVTASGVYRVVKTNTVSGCTATDSVRITALPKPSAPTLSYAADTMFITNYDPSVHYQWYSGNTALPGDTNRFLLPPHNGYYSVTATNAAGCSVTAVQYFNAVSPLLNAYTVTVSPNPSEGSFKVSMEGINTASVRMQVYTLQGTVLNEQELAVSNGTYAAEVNIGTQPAGIYLLRLSSGSKTYNVKLAVTK